MTQHFIFNKQNIEPGLVISSLSMFEGKVSNLDSGNEPQLSHRLYGVKLGQYLASVCRQRRQDFKTTQGQKTNVRLRVWAKLRLGDQADGILVSKL